MSPGDAVRPRRARARPFSGSVRFYLAFSTVVLALVVFEAFVFRVTQTSFGELPIRFTDDGRMTDGTIRAIGVRLNATSSQLLRGQQARLTTTVTGLGGMTEPATLTSTFRSLSAAVVQVEGGEPRVTIQPRDVRPDGTYVETRRLTGVQPGVFQIFGVLMARMRLRPRGCVRATPTRAKST